MTEGQKQIDLAAYMSGSIRNIMAKAFAELKKEGAIVSPVRCKWEPGVK